MSVSTTDTDVRDHPRHDRLFDEYFRTTEARVDSFVDDGKTNALPQGEIKRGLFMSPFDVRL